MAPEESSNIDAPLAALGDNAAHARRNHWLGVWAGAFAGLAQDFVHPEFILVGLISALTHNVFLAALVMVISKAGGLAPQLFVGQYIEHIPHRRRYFIILTVVRTATRVGMLGSMWWLTRGASAAALTAFFITYALSCVAGGVSAVIFKDMVGRLIPANRVGGFFGMRHSLGGGLSIVAGAFVIQPVLGAVELPYNYLLLAAIGAVMMVTDMCLWCACREEPGVSARTRTTLSEALQRGFEWLRTDHNYRCYFWLRVAFRINYLGMAFLIPYGVERLQYEGAGGVAMLGGIMVATVKLSAAVWGYVADRKGSRATFLAAGVFFLIAPALTLTASLLPGAFEIHLPMLTHGLDLPLCVFLLALAAYGAASRANIIAGQRFLITSAPPHRRPTYVSFLNTITSPLTLLPFAAAWFARATSMDHLFICLIGGALIYLLAAFRMTPGTAPSAPTDSGSGFNNVVPR
jgi:hypothetical protein